MPQFFDIKVWYKGVFISRTCFHDVSVGNDQDMAQSKRNSHSKNRGMKKKMTIRYLYFESIDRKPSQQLFPNRRPLSYPNLTKI